MPEEKEWIVLLKDSYGGDLGAIWQRCKQMWASESEGAQQAGQKVEKEVLALATELKELGIFSAESFKSSLEEKLKEKVIQLPAASTVGGSNDGIRMQLESGVLTMRDESARQILSAAMRHNVFLISGPPMVGKTAMLQLLHRIAGQYDFLDPQKRVVHFAERSYTSCAGCSSEYSFQEAFRQWNEGLQFNQGNLTPVQNLQGRRTARLILVDEVQHIFNDSVFPSFWQVVKDLKGNRGDGSIVIVMAAAYGSNPTHLLNERSLTTPVTLTDQQRATIRYPGDSGIIINLSLEEFNEWMDKFVRFHSLDGPSMQPVFDTIGAMTERIPGSVHHLLDLIRRRLLNNNRDQLAQKSLALLDSRTVYHCLGELHRGFMSEAAFGTGNTGLDLLIAELLQRDGMIDDVALSGMPLAAGDAALALRRVGHLVYHDGNLYIPSELHFLHTRYMFMKRRISSPSAMPSGIVDFVVQMVTKMDSSSLQRSLNKSAVDRPLQESAYHFEMYRAILSLIPPELNLSPHVGKRLGANGYCDLVLMPIGWAFEPLREHSDVQGHKDRFAPGGIYHPMVTSGKITAWVVLDYFQQSSRQPAHQVAGVVYVQFNAQFSQATVTQNGHSVMCPVIGTA